MWLEERLKEKGISQRELARRSGITAGAINHVLSGTRNPGEDFCTKIARGLGLPPEVVFRQAGLLPPAPKDVDDLEEWREILSYLSTAEREELRRIGWLKIDLRRQAELKEQMNKKLSRKQE